MCVAKKLQKTNFLIFCSMFTIMTLYKMQKNIFRIRKMCNIHFVGPQWRYVQCRKVKFYVAFAVTFIYYNAFCLLASLAIRTVLRTGLHLFSIKFFLLIKKRLAVLYDLVISWSKKAVSQFWSAVIVVNLQY